MSNCHEIWRGSNKWWFTKLTGSYYVDFFDNKKFKTIRDVQNEMYCFDVLATFSFSLTGSYGVALLVTTNLRRPRTIKMKCTVESDVLGTFPFRKKLIKAKPKFWRYFTQWRLAALEEWDIWRRKISGNPQNTIKLRCPWGIGRGVSKTGFWTVRRSHDARIPTWLIPFDLELLLNGS